MEGVGGVFDELDQKRAVARRDHVPLAQQHPPDAQAVDLGPVGAAQIDQMTERGLVVDLEMFSRERLVVDHREVDARRPPDRERIAAVRRSIPVPNEDLT